MLVTKVNRVVKSKGQGKDYLHVNSANENSWAGKNKTGIKNYLDEMLSSFIWLG